MLKKFLIVMSIFLLIFSIKVYSKDSCCIDEVYIDNMEYACFNCNKKKYVIEVPISRIEVPIVTVKIKDKYRKIIVPADEINKSTYIILKNNNDEIIDTYEFYFSYVDSSNESVYLKDLRVEGETIIDFNKKREYYEIIYDKLPIKNPTISADTLYDNVNIDIIQPIEIPGAGIIIVNNEKSMEYKIYKVMLKVK